MLFEHLPPHPPIRPAMNLRRIEAFLAVADAGNISRAAAQLEGSVVGGAAE